MSHDCNHTRPKGHTEPQLRDLIAMAETRCVAAGQRWTAPRRRVFALLLAAGAPVKAYDLIADYDEAEPGSTKPPTVYRALEFLEGAGLAHRIASLNAYVACATVERRHAASFLICDCCGSAEEVDHGLTDRVQTVAQARGFQAQGVTVEVRGVCARCSAQDGETRAA
jgi:Fur family zinc uptake transcriptional regulator